MATAIKYSRQRECIKEYLMHTDTHPTADMVYHHVREQFPKVSLGTVYRNLSLLTELGEIIKLDCGDGYDHFDANTKQHYHVVCTECRGVFDLHMEPIDHVNVLAGVNFNGKIAGHHIIFYGLCEECLNKQNQEQ